MSFDNLNPGDTPHFVYLTILLIALLSGLIFRGHIKASQLLKQALIWLVIIILLIIAYSYRYHFYDLKSRVSNEMFPARSVLLFIFAK
jgi:predicted aspartyl protease